MTQLPRALTLLATALTLTLTLGACEKKEEEKKAEADKPKDDKPSLILSNDTDACRKALKCCEAMVTAEKGSASPEDINLSCSGVGMAENDTMCDEFKKGFAVALEAGGKPVPDECK